MTLQAHVDLVELVSELAEVNRPRSEADVQAGVRTLLLYGDLELEDAEVRLETPAPGRRRIDVETGRTVIECKKNLSVGRVREDAVEQLAGYVSDRTRVLGQRYVGLLTDGAIWEAFQYHRTSGELQSVSKFHVESTDPDVDGLLVWLEGVMATAERLVPTPVEVERRLGAEAPGSQMDLAELADIYAQCREMPEARMKRELWGRLLSAAFGNHFADSDELFITHTYLVLVAEVIAHSVMSFDVGGSGLSAEDLVAGEVFRRHQIYGVVEADFFDWPLHSPQGVGFVNGLARRLSRFEWENVEHDVLKVLYESVIATDTRRQLGEYYTPDWLAQRIVEDTVDDPLDQRVLDPACGSGTFLFWAVRHYLEAAEIAGVPSREAVSEVTRHVFGIDLHPVAVTLARVTYLLAIGRERLQDRTELSIPVYLGDSIQYAQEARVLSPGGITIYTSDGLELFAQSLTFPESVVGDAGRFDQLVEGLASRAADRRPNTKPPGIKQLLDRHHVPESAREEVERAFGVLCHLHDNGRDHIWGYYVRNLARPLEFTRPQRRADRLVGNPPWLRYNAMPRQLQEEFRRLARERGLWAASHVVTSQDLSGLFVARACELYLRVGGRFGFVMPASTLSRQQYEGFRAARFASPDAEVTVEFGRPWELSGIEPQPFPVPASVVFGRRSDTQSLERMPAEADWWSGRVRNHYQSWRQVEERISRIVGPVVVADGEYPSPYGGMVVQGANFVPRVLLTVVEEPPTALGVPTGRTAVRSDRSSPERAPWRDVDDVTGMVEDQFLYPMVLGESLTPFRVRSSRSIVIPTDGASLYHGSDLLIDAYPGLAEWWRKVERIYDRLKPESTQHDLVGQINYQSKLMKQFPIGPHRVAYTGRGEITTAARIDDGRTVVDHALYWMATSTVEEAQYITGVLNSNILHERIAASLSQGLFGGRNIHRAPFGIYWPEYDPADSLHVGIARASAEAERVAAQVPLEESTRTAAARAQVREALRSAGVEAALDEGVSSLLDRDS